MRSEPRSAPAGSPVYRTSIACQPAGPFCGPMVVSMRPIPEHLVDLAVTTSLRGHTPGRRIGVAAELPDHPRAWSHVPDRPNPVQCRLLDGPLGGILIARQGRRPRDDQRRWDLPVHVDRVGWTGLGWWRRRPASDPDLGRHRHRVRQPARSGRQRCAHDGLGRRQYRHPQIAGTPALTDPSLAGLGCRHDAFPP